MPAPEAGGLYNVVAGNVTGPENRTLLSATSSLAWGVVVPMPTFCAMQSVKGTINISKTIILFMAVFLKVVLLSFLAHQFAFAMLPFFYFVLRLPGFLTHLFAFAVLSFLQ